MELLTVFLLGIPGGWEWIIIVIVVLLLFGGRKIPELMKGLGQGMKEFKNARNEAQEQKDKDESSAETDENNEPQKT